MTRLNPCCGWGTLTDTLAAPTAALGAPSGSPARPRPARAGGDRGERFNSYAAMNSAVACASACRSPWRMALEPTLVIAE